MSRIVSIRVGGSSQTVHFNAPSTGILQRSHPKSIFIRFPKGSDMENMVFPNNGENPYMHQYNYNYSARFSYPNPRIVQYKEKAEQYRQTDGKIEVVVLQILVFGNDSYLVEVVEPKYLTEEQEEYTCELIAD